MTIYKITARVTLDFDCEIKATEEFLYHWAGENCPSLENYQIALDESDHLFDLEKQELELQSAYGFNAGQLIIPAEICDSSVNDLRIRPVKD
jgi:hypothetical protein